MTANEFTEKMKEALKDKYYPVIKGHERADELMCQVLEELGFEEGIKLFRETDKFYA